jgi:hypothetical protein
MLAFLERGDVKTYGITRDDPKYLRRKLYEALFDFRTHGATNQSLAIGLPLNLFRVVGSDEDFKRNPLLGVVSIGLLQDRWDNYVAKEVHWAKALNAQSFIDDLLTIGYTHAAIRDMFANFVVSGILRPIIDSEIIYSGSGEHDSLYELYIADDNAIKSYHNILTCKNIDKSIQYMNSAVRARYGCGYFSKTDTFIYECLLNLVFLSDILHRERELAQMNKDSGVALRSYVGQIRGGLLHLWARVISAEMDSIPDRKSASPSTLPLITEKVALESKTLQRSFKKSVQA